MNLAKQIDPAMLVGTGDFYNFLVKHGETPPLPKGRMQWAPLGPVWIDFPRLHTPAR
jgi:hypothetical protein